MERISLVLYSLGVVLVLSLCTYLVLLVFIGPNRNPLRKLPGPKGERLFETRHMSLVMEYVLICISHSWLLTQLMQSQKVTIYSCILREGIWEKSLHPWAISGE